MADLDDFRDVTVDLIRLAETVTALGVTAMIIGSYSFFWYLERMVVRGPKGLLV